MSRLTSAATIASVLDHATSEIASDSKLGIVATNKIPGAGFKRPWPPLIKMGEGGVAKLIPSSGLATDWPHHSHI